MSGRFIDNGKAFEITAAPPQPWSNVITNGEFGSVWHDRGAAFAWCGNSVLDRLTRWDQDLVINRSWRVLYLAEGRRVIRSLTPSPCGSAATWKVVHGTGYSSYIGECRKYRTRLDVVVLADRNAEMWYVDVERLDGKPKKVRLVSAQDIALSSWSDTHREFHKLFIDAELMRGGKDARWFHALVFTKKLDPRPGNKEPWNCDFPGAMACSTSAKVKGFETDRAAFYGYGGNFESPGMIKEKPRKGALGQWGDSMAAFDTELEIPAGGVGRTAFVTAYGKDKADAITLARESLGIDKATALAAVAKFWEKQVGPMAAETPSEDVNPMLTHWLRYQAIAGRILARCGLYQASGAFGYRDQLQDSMLFLPYAAERTDRQLKLHMEKQFSEGDVLHWWHPKEGIGPREGYSDDYLWPIMVAAELYRETGDLKFLNEQVRFMDAPEASAWDHLRRALDRAEKRRSSRGLPLIGNGDWNDGLSSCGDEGRGESVWVGHFLHLLLGEMALLAEARGESSDDFRIRAKAMKDIVNLHGWDGEWYMQGTTDSGAPVGSNKCKEGKIHLNPQTWSVIAGTAIEDRAQKAMEAVKRMLVVDWGVLLLAPAYSTPDPAIGYLTRYAPGARENGGVYTHAAVWTIKAARMMGDFDLARKVAFALLPSVRGKDPRYKAEPYVTPGNIDGPTPTPGRGAWTWYTGSAAWLVRVWYEDVLGIRPQPDGMLFAPIVPAEWPGFKVTRPWRGRLLQLEFVRGNAAGVSVNGQEIAGQVLPFAAVAGLSGEIKVRVTYC